MVIFEMIRNSLNIIIDSCKLIFFQNKKARCGCKIFPRSVTDPSLKFGGKLYFGVGFSRYTSKIGVKYINMPLNCNQVSITKRIWYRIFSSTPEN